MYNLWLEMFFLNKNSHFLWHSPFEFVAVSTLNSSFADASLIQAVLFIKWMKLSLFWAFSPLDSNPLSWKHQINRKLNATLSTLVLPGFSVINYAAEAHFGNVSRLSIFLISPHYPQIQVNYTSLPKMKLSCALFGLKFSGDFWCVD